MRHALAACAAAAAAVAAVVAWAGQPAASAHWARGSTIGVWIDAAHAPAGAAGLVERAMGTWTSAADRRFTLAAAPSKDRAGIRVHFVSSDGTYGETRPRVDRGTGLIVAADVGITADVPGDILDQRIVVYLTALHELGHALGLPHTDVFSDIMYSFRRPDDGERYFGAYRRRLRSSDDIGSPSATGLSAADITALRRIYDR